jgi:hypothetical protein
VKIFARDGAQRSVGKKISEEDTDQPVFPQGTRIGKNLLRGEPVGMIVGPAC